MRTPAPRKLRTVDLASLFLCDGDKIVVRGLCANEAARRLKEALRKDGRGQRFDVFNAPALYRPNIVSIILDPHNVATTARYTVWASETDSVTLIDDETGHRFKMKLPRVLPAHSDERITFGVSA